LIETIGAEQRAVTNGIRGFNARQAALAQQIQSIYAKADAISDGAGTRATNGLPSELEVQLRWTLKFSMIGNGCCPSCVEFRAF